LSDNGNGSIYGLIFGISFIISSCLWTFFSGLWNQKLSNLTLGILWQIFWINLFISIGITILSAIIIWLLAKILTKDEEYMP
jgi:Na+-driven multidrug efflux pump